MIAVDTVATPVIAERRHVTENPRPNRSTMLHAISGLQPASFNFDARSVMLPVVPMFHAASWGLPWGGAAAGVKFVFSAVNDPAVLCELMNPDGTMARGSQVSDFARRNNFPVLTIDELVSVRLRQRIFCTG